MGDIANELRQWREGLEVAEPVASGVCGRAADEIESMRSRIAKLLNAIATPVPCRSCRRVIYYVQTKTQRAAPYTVEGLSHFADCPGAELFRKSSRKP